MLIFAEKYRILRYRIFQLRRVVSVDKIVQRSCHTRVFGEVVHAHGDPACLDACGDQKTNVTSPCWVDCFYKAALGPDSDKPGGAVAGLSALELMQAWLKPFNPEADGGCLCFFLTFILTSG